MNVTTFLDLRYKELPFLSEADREQVIEHIEDELIDMMVYSTSKQGS